MEGALASVKEITTEDDVEIHCQEFPSAQCSEEHFQWLKDAAQVDIITWMFAIHPIYYGL